MTSGFVLGPGEGPAYGFHGAAVARQPQGSLSGRRPRIRRVSLGGQRQDQNGCRGRTRCPAGWLHGDHDPVSGPDRRGQQGVRASKPAERAPDGLITQTW